MKKDKNFIVTITKTFTYEVPIEAPNEDTAIEIGCFIIQDDDKAFKYCISIDRDADISEVA